MRNPIQIQSNALIPEVKASLSVVKTFKKGTYVYHQFDNASQIFKLNTGLIAMGCYGEDGSENFTHFIGPGEYFGQEGLSGDARKSFALVLSGEAEVAAYDARSFLHQNEQLRILHGNLSKLMERMQRTLVRNTAMPLPERIKRTLLEIGMLCGVRLLNGEVLLRMKLKHRELAMLCSASRQSVTTQLIELSKSDYFQFDGGSMLLREKLLAHR